MVKEDHHNLPCISSRSLGIQGAPVTSRFTSTCEKKVEGVVVTGVGVGIERGGKNTVAPLRQLQADLQGKDPSF